MEWSNLLRQTAHLLKRGAIKFWTELSKGDPWKEFHAGSGMHADRTTRMFHAPQAGGVRCKYRSVGMGPPMTGSSGGAGVGQTLVLMVHRDDLPKARQIAAQVRSG